MVIGRPLLMRIVVYVLCVLVWPTVALAQEVKEAPAAQPADVRQFLILLDKPEVQQWLKSQTAIAAAPSQETKADTGIAGLLSSRLAQIRGRVGLVIDGAMNIRASIEIVTTRLQQEFSVNGTLRTMLQLLSLPLFAFVGDRVLSRRRFSLRSAAPQLRDPAMIPSAAGLAVL